MRRFRRLTPFLLMLFLVCGSTPAALAQATPTAPADMTVGALNFTEPQLLGEMIAQLLESHGYTVERDFGLATSADAHAALLSGEIDLYVEYTGGGLVSILGSPVPAVDQETSGTPEASVADRTYDAVSEGYAQFGLVWLDPFGFNDTYALAVTQATANAKNLATISDLVPYAAEMILGTDQEFANRADGLPALASTYGISFSAVLPGDPEAMYGSIANGQVDVITAYSTDAHLRDLDLVLLQDDRAVFPPYFAAPVVSQKLLQANPALQPIIDSLAGLIDDARMIELNYQVDIEGRALADVAGEFLTEQGLLSTS
jgi:glycine betaine/choline ABC-type transport system substrate-binding protein